MDWKKNKKVGLIAVVLIIVAIGVIVAVATYKGASGQVATFICEDSGRTFTVDLGPGNPDRGQYMVAPMEAVPCIYDSKKDAYLAEKDATGKWGKKAVPVYTD